jgi:PAT family beta-lactamase induction signal transducer AmpG
LLAERRPFGAAKSMTPTSAPVAAGKPAGTEVPARSAWLWVPSLYFSQGIPYVIVMTMSVVMYKRLGVSNTDIALYTSWLYLPWVIKPLWSPLVDITRTKRFWVVAMQCLVSVALALVAFSVRGNAFFKWSLLLFWIMAFASATHDIAADGFYMLSMSKHEQAWWVGLRSTFYRTAMIVGSGLLVVLAGVLESKNGLPPIEISVAAKSGAEAAPLPEKLDAEALRARASQPQEPNEMRLVASPESLTIPIAERNAEQAKALIGQAAKWNAEHGFLRQIVIAKPASQEDKKGKPPADQTAKAGNVGFLSLSLTRAPAAGQSVVVAFDRRKHGLEYVGLAKGDKGFVLLQGERLVFDASNWNVPAIVAIQLDPKLTKEAGVVFQGSSGNIPLAWSITLLVVAGLFLAFCLWHSLMLPHPANDGPVVTGQSLVRDFGSTLGSFFRKPGVLMAVAFILLYRLDEAQLVKVISPFLLDGRGAGGLGLTTSQVGLAYGTFGILALTCGGLLGGFAAAKYGLKTMLPYMLCSMYLPKLAWVFLAYTQPDNFLVACGAIALEQLGYGFGFTAFMLYMLYFADGPHKTAHYAICTGFMALGMMLPGLWSGWLADRIGYRHFFVWVICSIIPGLILALNLKVDREFGKR